MEAAVDVVFKTLVQVEVAYARTGAVAMTLHTHAWLGKVGENTSLECRSALERRDNRGPCEREFTLPEALPVPRNAAPNRPETPCLSVHYSAAALPHPSKVSVMSTCFCVLSTT